MPDTVVGTWDASVNNTDQDCCSSRGLYSSKRKQTVNSKDNNQLTIYYVERKVLWKKGQSTRNQKSGSGLDS